MINQNRLIVIVRLIGVYFLWQTAQALLLVLLLNTSFQKTSPASDLLNIFSGSSTNGIYLLQGLLTLLMQGFFSVVFLIRAQNISAWITRDISAKSDTNSKKQYDVITTVIKVLGLILFTLTFKDILKTLPSIIYTVENPLESPILIFFVIQIAFSLFLILRANVLANFISRFGK